MNDTISRQQTITALRALSDEYGYINVPHEVVTDVVRGLPPVQAEHEQTTRSERGETDKLGVKTGETCEDCISRQAAIDALRYAQHRFTVADEAGGMGTVKWSEDVIYFAAAKRVLDDLPSAQPEQRWIPCSERLPEEYGNYLATMDDGDVQECTFSPEKNTPFMRGGWSTCEADGILFLDIAEVIAWMPLPEPYKAERRTDESD